MRRTSRAVRRALAVVVLSSLSVACAAVLGFERLSAEDDSDAGVDATSETTTTVDGGADAESPACRLVGVPPPPPAQPDAAVLRDQEFALFSLDFGIDAKTEPAGLNLDRRCTTSLATGSCAPQSADQLLKIIDFDGGVDNGGFGLLQDLSLLGEAFTASKINERLRAGEYGAIVKVRNYNGTPNDDGISVEVYPALRHGQDGGAPDGGATDDWIRDRSYNFAGASTIRSSLAYVTDGVAVAFFETFVLPLSVPDQSPVNRRMHIRLRDVWMRAELRKQPDGNDGVRGVIAGRWPTVDFLKDVRQLTVPGVGTICKVTQPLNVYGEAKKTLCPGRDIRARSTEDDNALPCDAVSAGVGFTAYAVNGSSSEDPPVIPDPCTDAGIAEGDDCP